MSSPFDIRMLTVIPYAAATTTMILVGRSSHARDEHRWHLALAGAAGAVGLIWSAASDDNTAIGISPNC